MMRLDLKFEFILQGSTNLTTWTNLTHIILNGPSATVVDPATNAAARFYRVRVP